SSGIELKYSNENGRGRRVSRPGYFFFRPSAEENTGAAVIICPPGGYGYHTYEIAGFQLAKWFNTMGINAFVLISRLPHSPDLQERYTGPLTDAQRMIKLIRLQAGLWNIDPQRVGVMGSSAGGYLAATLSTCEEDFSHIGDGCDGIPVRPDFTILVSPVITLQGPWAHSGSLRNLLGDEPSEQLQIRFSADRQVTPRTPPAFLVHADDDRTVSAWNSLSYFTALKHAGIPASLHIFPQGGHSISLRGNPGSTRLWTELCEAWLKEIQIIE
ncbi:MAG: alpha/beta hydrolase, partial [Rikenellaceae bacterium]|nr:alpha/beta hydrolase [Rikenellaceae bacterium]